MSGLQMPGVFCIEAAPPWNFGPTRENRSKAEQKIDQLPRSSVPWLCFQGWRRPLFRTAYIQGSLVSFCASCTFPRVCDRRRRDRNSNTSGNINRFHTASLPGLGNTTKKSTSKQMVPNFGAKAGTTPSLRCTGELYKERSLAQMLL